MSSRLLLLLGVLQLAGRSAVAQLVCDGRLISAIHVTTGSLFTEEEGPLPGALQRLGNSVHSRTDEDVVRRELLFAAGQPCDPRRLAETERVLRALPTLRSASITTRAAADGGADVFVVTGDDWSIRAGMRLETGNRAGLRRLKLAEENVRGRMVGVQVRYNNEGRKPGFDVGLSTHQFLGHVDGSIVLGNSTVGPVAEQTFVRPFESEYDRMAWREAVRYRKDPFLFASPALGGVLQPTVVTGGEFGVGARFGRPGRLVVVGTVLSYERLFIEGAPLANDPAFDSVAAAELSGRFAERRRVRGHLLLGARSLRFSTLRGVDAVNGVEDVRLGFEGGVVAGRTLFSGNGLQRDWFGAAEFYGGMTSGPGRLLFLRAKLEGRRLDAGRNFDGLIASGDVLVYRRGSPTSVLVWTIAGAGGWRVKTPFQLTLGGIHGMRGIGYSALPAAQRVVMQVEHRHYVGTVLSAVDVGTALFVDAGQGWKGDVPFAVNSGVVGSLGAGLRLAFPRGSRFTYRIDVAVPVRGGRGFEIRTGFGQQFGVQRGEPDDVVRSREQVSSVTVFNFPRF